MKAKMATGEIVFNEEETRITRKIYLSTVEGRAAESIWFGKDVGTTRDGVAEIKSLFDGSTPFDTPKPTALVERMLAVAGVKDDDIVLDFFAGSGTTGHAVMKANRADGGRRRYVLVQLPEPATDPGSEYASIAAITRERLRRAGTKVAEEPTLAGTDIDTGFRAFRLTPSCFTVWEAQPRSEQQLHKQLTMGVDHVVPGATEEAMLSELLLKAGYLLTAPVKRVTFGSIEGYSVAEGALLVSLSPSLSIDAFDAMIECEPAMILVLDAGFGGSDELKVNALQTVRARNQQTGNDVALRVV